MREPLALPELPSDFPDPLASAIGVKFATAAVDVAEAGPADAEPSPDSSGSDTWNRRPATRRPTAPKTDQPGSPSI